MDIEDINRFLKLMRQHDLVELELERDGLRLRARKTENGLPSTPKPQRGVTPKARSGPSSHGAGLALVKAPILGTFYRAGGPDAPPFIQVGGVVQKGDLLCVIEAMKLMNEIKSEFEGEVVEVFVENGQAVNYGDRLFAIRQASGG
jgi:acetyl-CoA carboxylase biotin carboxyl carrier protein